MSNVALLKSNELTKNTIIGGSVDADRYVPAVKAAQRLKIKPLLGKELYDKICSDFSGNTLSGLYLELYEDYLKDMVSHASAEIYLTSGAYLVTNNGITKSFTDNSETVSKEEIDYLVQASRGLYYAYEADFLKWIKVNGPNIPEWSNGCDKKSTKYLDACGWLLKKRGCNNG
jgi:hypothetical protein